MFMRLFDLETLRAIEEVLLVILLTLGVAGLAVGVPAICLAVRGLFEQDQEEV